MARIARAMGILTTLTCVATTACAPTLGTRGSTVHAEPTPLPPGVTQQVGRDQIRLLHGGDATFQIIDGLIAGARHTVDLEMYEFGREDAAAALLAAQQRGLRIRVILDTSVDVSAAMAIRLRAAGIEVFSYPLRPMMIDHVKMLVLDSGATAVVGGINWGAASQRNHDVDAVIQGPAALNLESVFQRDLVTCAQAVAVSDPVPDPDVIVSTTLPGTDIRPLVLGVINGAQHSLDLELFVITDQSVVHAIAAAKQRGVAVRVLLDPGQRSSDPSAATLRGDAVAVRLFRSSGELLHAKFAVADGRQMVFGSANWSQGGFARNHEVDVEIVDSPVLGAEFEAAVNADWAGAA